MFRLSLFISVLLTVPNGILRAEMEDGVVEHNDIRNLVNYLMPINGVVQPKPKMPLQPLAFGLAQYQAAAANAQACKFVHTTGNGASGNGQNLFASTNLNATVGDAVTNWANEAKYYNFETGCQPGQICGHYTQIVSENSMVVGCAKQVCATLLDGDDNAVFNGQDAAYIVCDYSPPGNFVQAGNIEPDPPYIPEDFVDDENVDGLDFLPWQNLLLDE